MRSDPVQPNFNPLATSYIYCGVNCQPNLKTPNPSLVNHSDSIGLVTANIPNPLAATFNCG